MTVAPTPIPAETEGQAPILLSTSDPVFAMVLTAALALAPELKLIRVAVDGILDAARNAPDSMLLLDLDDMEISAAVRLVTKLTLVTRRPILLTAATAVLAMIPLSRSVFWGPMAVAIMGGLIVATALTLLALPAMYAAWFRVAPPPKSV